MNIKEYGEIKTNYNLVNDNTFKINSICDYFIIVDDTNNLINLIKYLNEKMIKYFIIGGGSNIVLPDYYKGVVIKLKFDELEIDNNTVEVGASYYLNKLAFETVNRNLAGLEWASGIPGTIGGSIVGNAGAYNDEIMNYVTKLEVIDAGVIKTIYQKDIKYDYRYTDLKDTIILKAYLKLKKGNKEELLETIKANTLKRINTQPLEYPSAGSIFRNPENNYAGKLIEDAGLKGYQIGGAKVSEKHANFIINYDNATSEDITQLIKYVKDEIYNLYKIDLTIETQIID